MTALHPRLQALQRQLGVSTLTRIADSATRAHCVELWLKRDDSIHPVISGNKWRKLKYPLNEALYAGAHTLVSMGGAYSNHLHALAFAARELGLNSAAYIRGERPGELNPTLRDLQRWGMQLHFVSRSAYRDLRYSDMTAEALNLQAGSYWIPEGGASRLALTGVAEIVSELDFAYDALVCACGTGTTLAGLISAARADTKILGVAALKGGEFLHRDILALLGRLQPACDWELLLNYHCGGFAKTSPELIDFISNFGRIHQVPLEPVYTGKAVYAIYDLLNKGYFAAGQRIVALHTGGVQGARRE